MPVIYVVGIGPGGLDEITPRAMEVIKSCDVVAGYEKYIDMLRPELDGKILYTSQMGNELDRCQISLKFAQEYGKNVAIISSGDAGVYGMAGLMLEVAAKSGQEVQIVPGITAANSCAAVLGAPLMNDYVVVSLSDLMTDCKMNLFEKRRQLVVVDARGAVVWTVGLRTDARVAVSDATQEVLEMELCDF